VAEVAAHPQLEQLVVLVVLAVLVHHLVLQGRQLPMLVGVVAEFTLQAPQAQAEPVEEEVVDY
jgi:hypothetical protein